MVFPDLDWFFVENALESVYFLSFSTWRLIKQSIKCEKHDENNRKNKNLPHSGNDTINVGGNWVWLSKFYGPKTGIKSDNFWSKTLRFESHK